MPRFHTLKIADVRKETEDTVSIAFDVPADLAEDYAFTQGQYLTLRTNIDGEDVRRSYSICSGVGEGELRVAIKKVDGGRFSTFANENLKPGATLDVMTPMGKFYTPIDPSKQRVYAAFAAGSGITPVMSIIKTVLDREPNSRFILFYGNRTVASIIFREELEDLKNRYLGRLSVYHILSREAQDVELFNGRIDAEKVETLSKSLCHPEAIDAFFVCGPATMIKDVTETLKKLGVSDDRIHYELFTTTPGVEVKEKAAHHGEVEGRNTESQVTIILDGVSTEFPISYNDGTILDAAVERGLDLPFSCKGGVCCTCRAKVVEGKVDMELNYSLEPDEVEAGFVLTCQSRPLTDKVVIDFDEA